MTNTGTESDLLSIPQVATYLGIAERTVLWWAQQGTIPCFKMGSLWRFRKSEIDRWLETQRSGPDVSGPSPSLTDPVEQPRSRARQSEDARQAREAMEEACVTYIEHLMDDQNRTVWVLEPLEEQFGQAVVQVAVRRLQKARKVTVRTMPGNQGRRVRVLHRR